jgi:autotransporter-associated beta strand protein
LTPMGGDWVQYTGGTTVKAGVLDIAACPNFQTLTYTTGDPPAPVTVYGPLAVQGGELRMGDVNSQTASGVQLAGGSITGSVTLTSHSDFDVQAGSASVNLAGDVGLTKTTTGAVTLTGVLTYTGTTILEGGTLQVNHTNVLTDIVRGSTTSGTLEVGGAGTTLTAQGVVNIGAAVIGSGDTLLLAPVTSSTAEAIDQITGAGALQVAGTNTTLTSGGVRVHALTINAGNKLIILPHSSAGTAGVGAGGATPVPEPSTFVLLVLAGLGVLLAARRRR